MSQSDIIVQHDKMVFSFGAIKIVVVANGLKSSSSKNNLHDVKSEGLQGHLIELEKHYESLTD
jgi:hypothetical protein